MSTIRNRRIQWLIFLLLITSFIGNQILQIPIKELSSSAILAMFIGVFMVLFNKILRFDEE